jgi:hypothetical protein
MSIGFVSSKDHQQWLLLLLQQEREERGGELWSAVGGSRRDPFFACFCGGGGQGFITNTEDIQRLKVTRIIHARHRDSAPARPRSR